jgi:hypothetical protein
MDATDGIPGSEQRLAEILTAANTHHEHHVEEFALDALASIAARDGDVETAQALRADADRRMLAADHFISERDRIDAPNLIPRPPAAR